MKTRSLSTLPCGFDAIQITDLDGAGSVFEVPIVRPLPEALNYFP
jgi:hypothetical protein